MRLALLLWALGGIVFTADALNILPNPSFEFWMDTIGVHLPVGWLSSELRYPGSAVKDSLSNSGNYCVHLIGGDTSAFITTATLVVLVSIMSFQVTPMCRGLLLGLLFFNS